MAYFKKLLGEKAKIYLDGDDFYDSELGVWQVYLAENGVDTTIYADAEIFDDGTSWDVWLKSVEWVPETQQYALQYEEY